MHGVVSAKPRSPVQTVTAQPGLKDKSYMAVGNRNPQDVSMS
jgi:hypothetical protein